MRFLVIMQDILCINSMGLLYKCCINMLNLIISRVQLASIPLIPLVLSHVNLGARIKFGLGKSLIFHSQVRGVYFYLYIVMDIYSRKIVGWNVHESQSSEYAAY